MSDPLKRMLDELSRQATPGVWGNASPKRIVFEGQHGPLMSWLVGDTRGPEGMKVSLGSERVADHDFVAALVNAWRCGDLEVTKRREPQLGSKE